MASSASKEALFINSVLYAEDMLTPGKHGIEPDMMVGYADEWRWVQTYYMKHHKLPGRVAFHNQFPSFVLKRVSDVAHFAEEVVNAHTEREVIKFLKSTAGLISAGDLEGALAYAHSNIISVAAQRGLTIEGDIFSDADDVMQEYEDALARTAETGNAGIPSGFITFDAETGGAKPGELITIAARLGQGKSWGLSGWAAEAARAGYTAVFNSLEMTRGQMTSRIYSLLGDIGGQTFNSRDLTQGKNFTMTDLRKFAKNLEKNLAGKIHVVDKGRGHVTPATIAAQIERINPDIVFIDYISLMAKVKDWQVIGTITGELKQIAIRYKVPIVMAAQLNRNAEEASKKGIPAGPGDIAQSDMIGHDSDTIITLAKQSEHCVAMRCVKNRHGRDDFTWYNEFDVARGIFREVDHARRTEIVDQDKADKAQNDRALTGDVSDDDGDQY